MPRKKFKICVPLLAVFMAILLAGLLIPHNSFHARAQEVEKAFDEVKAIKLKPSLLSYISVHEDDAKELFKIGIGGVPLLLEEIDKIVTDTGSYDMYCAFYMLGVETLLCVDDENVRYAGEDIFDLPNVNFKIFVRQAKEKIPQIIQSDQLVEKKVEELSKYGVLSLLYLTDEKGRIAKEYEPYLEKIGLSYSPAERMYPSAAPAKSETAFDVDAWLSANKYDLQILKQYLEKKIG